jgi:DNA-binding GntR family transcriptional regulator
MNLPDRALFDEPEARTVASQLMGRLRTEILRGDLAPGAKLNLEELKTRFKVSLSPLREALSRLGADGLVQVEDQRGYWVAPISGDDLAEVTRLRMEFESLALREAIARGGPAWEAGVVAAWEALKSEAGDGAARDMPAWEAAHRRYHFTLLSACGMPLLLRFIANLHDLSDRYRRLFLLAHPGDRDVPGEHQRIMEAALERQPEVATALLRQHIQRTGDNVARALLAAPEHPGKIKVRKGRAVAAE